MPPTKPLSQKLNKFCAVFGKIKIFTIDEITLFGTLCKSNFNAAKKTSCRTTFQFIKIS